MKTQNANTPIIKGFRYIDVLWMFCIFLGREIQVNKTILS